MKSWKLFWTVVFVGSFLTMGLTACGKKDDSKNTSVSYLSMTSDGQTVTSNSTLGGMQMNLQMRNLQAYAASGYQGNVTFDLTINGSYANPQTNRVYADFTQYAGATYSQLGQYYVVSAGRCADASCSVIYASTIVAGCYQQQQQYQYQQQGCTMWEYKQFAVKKVNGQISGLREWTGSQTLDMAGIMRQF